MKSVKIIALQLHALDNPKWSTNEMKQFEMKIVHFFEYISIPSFYYLN